MMKIKKELPFFGLAILPFVYLAFIWKQLPARIPIHWDGEGNINGWGDKKELLFVVFSLVAIPYFLFLFLPKIDPKQNLQKMGNKLQNLRLFLTLFMSVLAIYILYSTQQRESSPGFMFSLLGLLFAFLGNYMKTIKPNYFIGIKTPWTLENEAVWKATHLLAGKMWFVGGLLMAFTFLLPNKIPFYTFITITFVITIVPIVYSYLEYKKTKQ